MYRVLCILLILGLSLSSQSQSLDDRILFYEIAPSKSEIHLFWKTTKDSVFGNFEVLSKHLRTKGKSLKFAMNGGMYKRDQSPQGLYIEKGVEYAPLDTLQEGYGNFYMQPNGIFYIDKDKKPGIHVSKEFRNEDISYATQSGPMLLIEGKMHPKFRKGSPNVHIRNGIGILPNGNVPFAMSKEKINFFDFATFFKNKGCENALYLDGFVSRTYLPSKNWTQLDGNFGVIIAEIE
ncbi:MAG: phosphodiester glycosidase family protein [Flavobacteriales bacterium]|nr:phosphodiester glycosidase family protein [Flavobacteriales bacterium]